MRRRWAYMGRPDYNPPSDACPACTTPSRTWFLGGKTVDGVQQFRYRCDAGHCWMLRGGEVLLLTEGDTR